MADEAGAPGAMVHSLALAGEMRDGRHRLLVRVYYEDTDFSGLVYHASYLRFMERGRTEYLRHLGVTQQALFEHVSDSDAAGSAGGGYAFAVRSMRLDFLKAARMDDVLEIITAPQELKGASIHLHQQVTRGPDVLLDADVRVAFLRAGRPVRIPHPLRQAMLGDLASRE